MTQLSFAILPAVTLPIWISLFADRDLSLVAQRRVGVALLAVGVLFLSTLILGVAMFMTR